MSSSSVAKIEKSSTIKIIDKIAKKINFNNDETKAILLVDVSYYTYARFFGLRIWYNNNFKDKENIDLNQDWTKNQVFMQKFDKLFFTKIIDICKKHNIDEDNILYAIDSSFDSNWRLQFLKEYKETRPQSHKSNKFNSWEIFNHVKNNILKNKKTVEIDKLEADDVVALLIRKLKQLDPTSSNDRSVKYYILATDKDYIQICNDRTLLIDINGKDISSKNLTEYSNLDFLLRKIMLGDKSDNIPACFMTRKLIDTAAISSKKETLKCTPAKVEQVMNNCKELIIEELHNCRNKLNNKNDLFVNNQFCKNAIIIDFAHIPL